MNVYCLFCQQLMTSEPNISYISYCHNHQQQVQYLKPSTHSPNHFYFKNNISAPLSSTWDFFIYDNLNFPNKYILYSYTYILSSPPNLPQLKLMYQGEMPPNFSPETCQNFIDRLLSLKAFL